MAAPTPARAAALQSLRDVRGGALADRAFAGAAAELDSRDRAWAHELVYGTLRLRGRLDFMIAALSTRPLDRLDRDILDILRLGAYQLLEMGSVPAYAAVSQSVELARSVSPRAAGFVNAVLQSLRRRPTVSTFPAFSEDPAAHLSTWGSHPRWLVDRWIVRYGVEAARRLVEANNRRPALYLRVVPSDTGLVRDDVADRLRGAGIDTEPVAFAPHALRVVAGSVEDALAAAPVIVQDPAAGLVVDFAAVTGGTVLDLAAAPGGKALALALTPRAFGTDGGASVDTREDVADASTFVVAADRSADRLARLVANVRRLTRPAPEGVGAVPAAAVVADVRSAPFRGAATVLLDAPCTGTGTLRRHPDGRWRLGPDDLHALVTLQAALLDCAAELVTPGGLLVYSTCSLEPEENEGQVSAFLERHADFCLERGAGVESSLIHADGTLRVTPHDHAVDGAYCAKLRRTEERRMKSHAG